MLSLSIAVTSVCANTRHADDEVLVYDGREQFWLLVRSMDCVFVVVQVLTEKGAIRSLTYFVWFERIFNSLACIAQEEVCPTYFRCIVINEFVYCQFGILLPCLGECRRLFVVESKHTLDIVFQGKRG